MHSYFLGMIDSLVTVYYMRHSLNYESSSHQWGGAMPTEARANDVWLVEVVVDAMKCTSQPPTHPPELD